MICAEARALALDRSCRQLLPALERELEAHLAGCERCARADGAERALTELLEARLPRGPAPAPLVRRIAALAPGARAGRDRGRAARRVGVAALAAVAAGLLVAVASWNAARSAGQRATLEAEAVSDHLRSLLAQRPLEVESGGVHQVKPWFEGRLDFAPVVPDLSGAGLTLRGGAVGYLHDRRVASLRYQLRAHLVTLLVFRAEGLSLAATPRAVADDRGFHAAVWRSGALGYALVADVDPQELRRVAEEIARAARPPSDPGG
jgi:anti-sigma factor RsiW